MKAFSILLLMAFGCSVECLPSAKMVVSSADSNSLPSPIQPGDDSLMAGYFYTRDEYQRQHRRNVEASGDNETALISDATLMDLQSEAVNASFMESQDNSASSNPSRANPDIGAATTTQDASSASIRQATSPLLVNHGGIILPSVVTKNIFWGRSWATYTGDKMTGMNNLCTGLNNSHYVNTAAEYTGSNGAIGPVITHLGFVVDTSTASGGGSTNAILREVCKMITSPVSNGFYFVFVDLPRGNANYCAYHSYGTCAGVTVQFGFAWNLDGDPGCDPQSTVAGQSQGLQAIANVYAHEIMETKTDPRLATWYDAQGEEIADKCAWTFATPYVTLSNSLNFKLQSEWSNKAFTAGTGSPNLSGQHGCINSA